MSTTLNWASSGNAASNTGTTPSGVINDLNTLITSKSGVAAFNWQVAGSSLATTPFYVVLSRKDASAGRIVVMSLSTAFTSIQPTMFDQLPAISNVFIGWFPNGTASTLLNLNATSGTVCGNDTGAVKCSSFAAVGGSYSAAARLFYYDSYDGIYLCACDPASPAQYVVGAGQLVEDASGVAYDTTLGTGNSSSFGASFGTGTFTYVGLSGIVNSGALPNSVRVNYTPIPTATQFYSPFTGVGVWATLLNSSADSVLADNANSKVWFAPFTLMPNTKGGGAVLKLRQLGYGPGTTGPFAAYNTTGPVQQAIQMINATAGSTSGAWLTNFKI